MRFDARASVRASGHILVDFRLCTLRIHTTFHQWLAFPTEVKFHAFGNVAAKEEFRLKRLPEFHILE